MLFRSSTLNRVAVIRNTSFIQSGYVLMAFLVGVLQISLAVVSFPSTAMSWVAPSVLSLAYAYLLLLVRDLDNPFGHGENDGAGSGADVDITPVRNAVAVLMGVELMLNAVNLTLIAFSRFSAAFAKGEEPLSGHVFVVFVLTVAAAEAAVALAMAVLVYRRRETVDLDRINLLQG